MGHQSTLSLDHVDNDHRKVEGLDTRSERDKDEEDEIDDEEERRDIDQSQQSKRRGDNGKTQDKERTYMTGRNNKGKASTASRDNKNKGKGHPAPGLITGADCATDTDAKDAAAAATLPAGALFIHPDMKVHTHSHNKYKIWYFASLLFLCYVLCAQTCLVGL